MEWTSSAQTTNCEAASETCFFFKAEHSYVPTRLQGFAFGILGMAYLAYADAHAAYASAKK